MEDNHVRDAMRRDLTEAYKHGGEAHGVDSVISLTNKSWGFELSDIQMPVYLWHGELDTLVTRAMAEYLSSAIPHCEARFVPDGGHFLMEHPAVIKEVHDVLRSAFAE